MGDRITEMIRKIEEAWDLEIQDKAEKKIEVKKPTLFLGLFEKEWFITVNDHQSVFSFVSFRKGVHMAVRSKCHPFPAEITPYCYSIEEDALQIVSCPKPETKTELERFVIETIIPKIIPPEE